jgi:hypothetical protein
VSIYVCMYLCMYVCSGSIGPEELWNSMQELGYEFSRAEVRACVVLFSCLCMYVCVYVYVCMCVCMCVLGM